MTLVDVKCRSNSSAINARAKHVEGKILDFSIPPGKALIDEHDCIRFFVLDWGNGESHGYLLHPYSAPLSSRLNWVEAFLGTYGLSRMRGALVKPAGKAGQLKYEAVMIGSYFVFAGVGGEIFKSFISKNFAKQHLGYHNIATDKLIWPDPLYIGG